MARWDQEEEDRYAWRDRGTADRDPAEDRPDIRYTRSRGGLRRKRYRPHLDDRDLPYHSEAMRSWGREGARYPRPLDYGTARAEEHWSTDTYETRVRPRFDPGPYTGFAPKGWRRSPERIRDEICQRMTDHARLDPTDIEIEVDEDGEVTLTGAVRSRAEKRLAEDVAEQARGVRDVHNRLSIVRPEAARQR